jgi:magnesium chelatase family protein
MNPCPCGYLGDASGRCRCTPDSIAHYRARISGPLADRIDLKVEAPVPRDAELLAAAAGESSESIRARVSAARARQLARQDKPNALLATRELEQHCALDQAGETLVKQAMARLALSARALHRVLRVARSIADLAGADRLASTHLAEAIQYRRMDAAL